MIKTRMIMTIIFITTKTLWPVAPVMWFRFRSGDGAVPTEADNEDGDDDEAMLTMVVMMMTMRAVLWRKRSGVFYSP